MSAEWLLATICQASKYNCIQMQLENVDQLSFSIGKNFVQQQFCIFTGTEVTYHIFMCIYIP